MDSLVQLSLQKDIDLYYETGEITKKLQSYIDRMKDVSPKKEKRIKVLDEKIAEFFEDDIDDDEEEVYDDEFDDQAKLALL